MRLVRFILKAEGDISRSGKNRLGVDKRGRVHWVSNQLDLFGAKPKPATPPPPPSAVAARYTSDDPNSPHYRYRDTGHIGGARKEEAANYIRRQARAGQRVAPTDIDWPELETNPREAHELITKSNLFGQVDWRTLRDGGMESAAGYLIDRVYASIAPEPTDDPQARKDYVLGLHSLRERLERCTSAKEVTAELQTIRDEYDGQLLTAEEEQRLGILNRLSQDAWTRMRQVEGQWTLAHQLTTEAQGERWRLGRDVESRKRRGWKVSAEAQAAYDAATRAYEEANAKYMALVKQLRPERDAAQTVGHQCHAEADAIRRAAILRNRVQNPACRAWRTLGLRFEGVLRYRSFKGSDAFGRHVAAALAGQPASWSWAEKETAHGAVRTSKERIRFALRVADRIDRVGGREVDVSSTLALKERFGLREVESGNWVLRDPVSAKFHVQQAAAALADLADLMGVEDADIAMHGRVALAFGARGRGAIGWAEGAPAAQYEPVKRVINLTKMSGGGCLGHELFHAIDNLMVEAVTGTPAKADDRVTDTPELLPAGELRDAVEGLRRAMLDGDVQATETITYSTRDYATARHNIAREFPNTLAKRIRDAADVHAAVAAVEDYFAPRSGRDLTPREKKRIRDWRQLAVAWHGGNADGGQVLLRSGPTMSAFAAAASVLDEAQGREYWSRPREMAARAFQSWIEDSLAAKGRQSDYLSAYASNRHYPPGVRPFPEGDERTRINAAVDKLVAVMRSERVMAKAAALLRRGQQRLVLLGRRCA